MGEIQENKREDKEEGRVSKREREEEGKGEGGAQVAGNKYSHVFRPNYPGFRDGHEGEGEERVRGTEGKRRKEQGKWKGRGVNEVNR